MCPGLLMAHSHWPCRSAVHLERNFRTFRTSFCHVGSWPRAVRTSRARSWLLKGMLVVRQGWTGRRPSGKPGFGEIAGRCAAALRATALRCGALRALQGAGGTAGHCRELQGVAGELQALRGVGALGRCGALQCVAGNSRSCGERQACAAV